MLNISTESKAEIDKRVAQELKNNRDFVYETNQSLQNLALALQDIKSQMAAHIAMISSEITKQKTDNERFQERYLLGVKSSIAGIEAYRSMFIEARKQIDDHIKDNQNKYLPIVEHKSDMQSMLHDINSLKHRLQILEQRVSREIIEVEQECLHAVDDLRKEIMSMPSEAPEILDAVSDRLQACDVNNQGVLRELEIIKAEQFSQRKHIEYIITNIKRLKEQ